MMVVKGKNGGYSGYCCADGGSDGGDSDGNGGGDHDSAMTMVALVVVKAVL